MKQKFLSNLLFLLFANLLVKPIYVFGIDLKVQNVVGSEEYGLYFTLFGHAYLFFILLDLGLTQYNSRVIAQNHNLLEELLPNFLMSKAMLGVVYFVATFLGALILGYKGRELWLLGCLGGMQIMNSLNLYLRSNVAALQMFRLDALLSIINRLVLIFACGLMLYGSFSASFKIEHFIYAQIGSQAIAAIISFSAVLRYAKFQKIQVKWNLALRIIKEGYPYALLVLLTTLYTRTDAIMIRELLVNGEQEAGYYGGGYRILDMANMIGVLMASQLLPLFSKLIADKAKNEIREIVNTSFRLLMFISISASICITVNGEEISALLLKADEYPPEYVGWILSLLILSFVPVASSYIFNTLLNANQNLRILNIIGLIGFILNIILNFVFIPKYAALGAVYATLFTQGMVGMSHIILAQKKMNLEMPLSLFLRVILFGLLIFGILEYSIAILPVSWMVQFLLGGIICIPVGFLLKLWSVDMIKDLKP